MGNALLPNRWKILSGSALKLIAAAAMLIDHFAYTLAPEIQWMYAPLFTVASKQITLFYLMRRIGRIAFPIFCFLISEGFSHTRNQKRYAYNLLLFALISEIPFNLMTSGRFWNIKAQNVFFTLFLGVLMMYILENMKSKPCKAFALVSVAAVASVLKADYGIWGALLILMLYVFKEKPIAQVILAFPLLSGVFAAWAAFIPINMYNGKRGFISSGIMKYFFYFFYPVHIIVLVLIKVILINK